MAQRQAESVQACPDHLSDGRTTQGPKRCSHRQEDFSPRDARSHLLEVSKNDGAHGAAQRIDLLVPGLGARHGEQLVLSVQILEAQATDLPTTQPVDRQ